ncbi:urease accessory protein UreD [Ideonella sp. YS5]|uniref:urease accessory protein UreD n=1 Tax=Ideonella sp. YS5 TaxID=3453714 RepID=UPI003EE987B5
MPDANRGWRGELAIDYWREDGRTLAHDRHVGPLRVLQRLYPEGPGICHHVLVHPPGGLVGGDTLDVSLELGSGSHALLTTPGAARFYRSAGPVAAQQVSARLAEGARLEWLPLETIAYRGCRARNSLRFELAPQAEMMGWDLLALGLPAAGQDFEGAGEVWQHLEWPGVWLERGHLAAADRALIASPLGLDGCSVLATLWWASGTPMSTGRRDALLEAARDCFAEHPALASRAGVSALDARLIVARVLSPRVEPAFALWRSVRQRWRAIGWDAAGDAPRLWRT